MSRLSLLLFVVFVALVAGGCGSHKHKAEAQAVLAIQATDPSATDQDLKNGADLVVDRLARLGVPRDQINVRRDGASLKVEFPRRLVPATSLSLVTRQTRFEVYDLEKDLAGPSKTAQPATSLYSLLAPQQQEIEFKGADGWELFDKSTRKLVAGPTKIPEALFKTRVAKLRHVKPGKPPYVVFGIPKKTVAVSCGPQAVVCPPGVATAVQRTWYLFTYRPSDEAHPVPELTSTDVAGAADEVDPIQGPVVVVDLTGAGTRKLREVTRTLYQRGQLLQSPQHLALVVDRRIRSFPQIDYRDETLASGISSGGVQIAGLRTPDGAKELARALQPLPVKVTRVG
jgi:hypothetical protein